MFNLLATNLHDGNAHNLDFTSSLGLIGNSILMSTQQGVTSSSRGREFSSSPGKKFLVSRKKLITFNIPTRKCWQNAHLVNTIQLTLVSSEVSIV